LPRARGKRLFGSLARVRGTGGRQIQMYRLWEWIFYNRPLLLVQAMLLLKVPVTPVYHTFLWEHGAFQRILANCGLSCIYSLCKFVFIIIEGCLLGMDAMEPIISA
jgi:hypothetical protein